MFAFGSAAVPINKYSRGQLPFALAAGTATAASAGVAANAFGQLFGFGSGASPGGIGGGPFGVGGVVGSAFQFAASNGAAAAVPQLTVTRAALPDQELPVLALPQADVTDDADEDAADEEGGFALPADLLESEGEPMCANMQQVAAGDANQQYHTHI